MLMKALMFAGTAAVLWKMWKAAPAQPEPAAFATGEAQPGNFVQVRNAGPAAMRSDPPHWDAVDEASDASFPASDPPAAKIT